MRHNEFKAHVTRAFARRGRKIKAFDKLHRVTYPTGNRGINAFVTDEHGFQYTAEMILSDTMLVDLVVKPRPAMVAVERVLTVDAEEVAS